MTENVDQNIRDRAAQTIDRSMALAAGAGVGKTHVLVDRVVAMLASGGEPKRIAVITFTERAAGEVLERVHDRCEENGVDARLEDLTISTIHAFAGDLLRAEAFEAGWTPDAELVSEALTTSAVDAAYRKWRSDFDARHPDDAPRIREVVKEVTLRNRVMELLRFRDLKPVVGPAELDYKTLRVQFEAVRAEIEAALSGCLKPNTCKLVQGNQDLLTALSNAASTRNDQDAFNAFVHAPNGNLRGGSAKDWTSGAKERFGACVGRYRTLKEEAANAQWIPLHRRVVLDLHDVFFAMVDEEKRARSQYDFDDLLLRCASLLRDRAAARARLARRFDCILVDEVQDTDPIQAEIVALLVRDPQAVGSWKDHPPRNGSIFAVGDPKQSIYRFRRADVATWRELQSLIAKNGDTASLTQSFRSVPGIVAFANHVFAGLPEYEALVPARKVGTIDPIVVLRADEPSETDAAVRHLLDLVGSGKEIEVRGKRRPVTWADVMVLLPSWTNADSTQEAFHAAGIDCFVEGGARLFERDEVKLALAAMKAIDEPGDGESVVFTLRGLFGLSHAELAEHRALEGAWRYTIPNPPAGPVADAFLVLRRLHLARGRMTWSEILDHLLEVTRASAVWSLTARGRSMLANVEKVKALVRQFEPAARAPSDIVKRIQALSKRGDDQDLPVSDPDANAVKITTLFKAKGLEKPVVVILHARRRVQPTNVIVDRDEGTVAVDFGDLEPPGMTQTREKEKQARADETRRWMYVAATRASDQLVIALTEKSNLLETEDLQRGLVGIDRAAHDELWPLAEGVEVRVRDVANLPRATVQGQTFPALDDAVDALLAAPPSNGDREGDERARDIDERVKSAKAASRRWASVTEWVRPVRKKESSVGVLGGRVVHAVMESLDLSKERSELESAVPRLLRAQSIMFGLSDALRDKCESVVLRILRDPILDRARTASERWQEVTFAFPEKNGIVSGTIDLCFPVDETKKKWVVVDWKSDVAPKGSKLRRAYEKQLDTYAKALVANLAGVVPDDIEKVLVGPHPELAKVVAEDAVDGVDAELRRGLEQLIAATGEVPSIGLDIGEPVIAEVEIAFETRMIALALDRTDEQIEKIESEGWKIVRADRGQERWAGAAIDALAKALEVNIGDSMEPS